MTSITELAAFGEKLADASAEIVLNYWRSELSHCKSDESLSQRLTGSRKIRQLIESEYPHHGISGGLVQNIFGLSTQ